MRRRRRAGWYGLPKSIASGSMPSGALFQPLIEFDVIAALPESERVAEQRKYRDQE